MMSRIFKIGAEGIDAEGKPEKILNEVGVAVRDNEGQFRDFSSILDDLSVKWKTMSDTQKLAVSQQVAGIQRYNDFISLMNNYQLATDATTKAINSQGSATKENQIYMQSAEARLNQLKATWQSIALNTFDSSGMRTMLSLANDLSKSFANIPTVIMSIVTAITLWKGVAIGNWISASILTPMSELGTVFMQDAKMMGTLNASTQLAKSGFSSLWGVISANPLGAIALAITGIIIAIDKVKTSSEKLQEVNDEIDKTKKTLSDMSDANSLAIQFNELETKMKSGTLSTDEMAQSKKDLISVQEKLAQTFPDLITG